MCCLLAMTRNTRIAFSDVQSSPPQSTSSQIGHMRPCHAVVGILMLLPAPLLSLVSEFPPCLLLFLSSSLLHVSLLLPAWCPTEARFSASCWYPWCCKLSCCSASCLCPCYCWHPWCCKLSCCSASCFCPCCCWHPWCCKLSCCSASCLCPCCCWYPWCC